MNKNSNNNVSKNQLSINIQLKYVIKLLQKIFGHYNKITNEMNNLIMDYLFASPFRRKNIFVFKQGNILVYMNKVKRALKSQILTENYKQVCNPQISINPNLYNYKQISSNQSIPLKQKTHYIIANKFHHNQKLLVTKIWAKPPTRTQKKILTYCGKFKQFIFGQHLTNKTIDLRFLKRQFLIPFHQLQQFQKHLSNIKQNDVNFCSFDVIDSYMVLVTKNWIEIQLQSNQIGDKQQKVYKVIPQGCEQMQILTGISLQFQQSDKKWYLKGEKLNIWQQQNVWSRNQTLIRTLQGQVQLIEGNILQRIGNVQLCDF